MRGRRSRGRSGQGPKGPDLTALSVGSASLDPTYPFRGKSEGFTLIEILIAVAILGVIMTIVYGSFVQTRKVIGAAEESVEGYREIRAAFRLMTHDIAMAYISTSKSTSAPIIDWKEYTPFVGTDDYATGHPADSLSFAAFSHRPRTPDATESDQNEIGYFLRREVATLDESEGEEESSLMRREKKRIDLSPTTGGRVREVAGGILGIDFRYLDKNGAWFESWDSRSSADPLPRAVEITLITKDRRGEERPYRTVVEVPLAP